MKSSVPLYHHLKAELLKQMEHGDLGPGQLLPSEAALTRQYQVSRTTVRQALGDLVSMGYLVRRQGKGTYVATRSSTNTASKLYGFVEELRYKGFDVSVRRNEFAMIACPDNIAENLLVPLRTPVLLISRLVSAGERPVFREDSYLIPPFQWHDMSYFDEEYVFEGVYAFFEENGVKIALGNQSITAETATAEDAALLGLNAGNPVLVIRRVTQDETGTPVEYSEVRYASEQYRYEVNLLRLQEGD